MKLYLGIDLGTSGVRTSVIDESGQYVASVQSNIDAPILIDDRPCQDATLWLRALEHCMAGLSTELQAARRSMLEIDALAVDGTSGTLLLTDRQLNPVTLAYMYNSARFDDQAEMIAQHAPENCLANGAGSTLARLLFLQTIAESPATYALHQADWIAARLMDRGGMSDETNVLKLGYDVHERCWPEWIAKCGAEMSLLPQAFPVGDQMGTVCESAANQFGLSAQTRVIAGATDSNAAFLASGANRVGDGVTSLGTTLAIKLLSDKPVVDTKRGIYSHRIKDMWLPGGASNSGGGVLLDHFTVEQIRELQTEIDPNRPTELSFYPLSRPGERFPICDPTFQPKVTPRPPSDATFLQAMLEGMAEIERTGYAALQELGASNLTRVFTAGGGAASHVWTQIREARLGVPIVCASSTDASIGTARIAAGLI